MLSEQRFLEILNLLERQGTITVRELAECLSASESTVRRDLSALHNMGKLKKVFGGAASREVSTVSRDDLVSVRHNRNMDEKLRIAQAAVTLLEPNDFVYVDAGTTTGMLAEQAPSESTVFVTNGVFHARTLGQKGCRVYLLGGEFKFTTEAVVGGRALDDLARYSFSKGFFGTNGISLTRGFSTPDEREALVKSHAMSRCKKAYVLADPTKFNVVSPVTFAAFDAAEIITTRVESEIFRAKSNVWEVDLAQS
jgi:DeoR family fructose operon transcriptional repressor